MGIYRVFAGSDGESHIEELRLEEHVGDSADGFFPCRAIQLFGAAIPVGDDVTHVADEDRVMSEVEKLRLSTQHLDSRLVPEGEQGRDCDRRETHDPTHQRPLLEGRSMGEEIAQDCERQAAGRHEHYIAASIETRRHQDDDDIENGNGKAIGCRGIEDEDHQGEKPHREQKKPRRHNGRK